MLLLCPLLILSAFASIPNLDTESQVYISPSGSAYMQITSNPSTGYHWTLSLSNPTKLSVEDSDGEYFAPNSALTGAPGYQLFRVDCKSECQDGDREILTFEYARSWESHAAETKYVTLIVSSEPRIQ